VSEALVQHGVVDVNCAAVSDKLTGGIRYGTFNRLFSRDAYGTL